MKLCPQCDFIYEDDQSVCDMDGKELVPSPAVVSDQDVATSVSATPVPVSEVLPVASAGRRWRNFALLTLFVLATLIIVIYLARANQLRSLRAPEESESSRDRSAGPAQPTSEATVGQPSSSESESTQTPAVDAALSEQSPEQPSELSSAERDQAAASSASSTAKEALAHTRLTPGPVSAGAPSGNSRGPVIVRLNNGVAIRADEAWEKREGIWYRQGGVVTFLKRSEVRTIERLPSPAARSKPAVNAAEKTKQTEPPADTKKESKVTSFLKKTGRILKKPFKF